jgi:hypothetical protein
MSFFHLNQRPSADTPILDYLREMGRRGIPDVCQITPVHVRQQRDIRLRIRGVSQGYKVYLHISHGVECRLVWS